MTTPEQRARRWLRIYPRAYRERRGEELLATLLDKARDDPRLSVREIRAIIVHAASLRVRRLPVLIVAACAALLGSGLGAAIGGWGGSNGYAATTIVLPAQLGAADFPSAVLTSELRAQSTRFAAFRRTPPAQALIVRQLAAPYPTCSVSVVDDVGNRGVQLQCSSTSAQTAQTAMFDQSQAIELMFERERVATFAQAETRTIQAVATLRVRQSILQHELATTPRSSPTRAPLAYMLSQGRSRLSLEQSLARRLAAEVRNVGGISSGVMGPPTATYGVTALPIELGAAAGLLIGLAIGIGTRRERRRPARA
jgi:hypothetical protein